MKINKSIGIQTTRKEILKKYYGNSYSYIVIYLYTKVYRLTKKNIPDL